MLYISPINEAVCRNGLAKQVLEWSGKIAESKGVLAGQMNADIKELSTNWLPGENQNSNLTKGWRRKIRYVFGYNGNGEIALYAKFEMKDTDVHLHWVVARPEESGRIDCGAGVLPLRSMLAFAATAGKVVGLPVVLLADDKPLVQKYGESGWELTGRIESSKPEMILLVKDLDRPLTTHKPQVEGTHWVFSGENSLAAYLGNGAL